jgi:plastocyanin
MRRLTLTLVVAVAAAGIAALPAGASPNTFSFIQVVEKEFTLTPSRSSVRAGSVSLELINFGMDTHDLVVQSTKAGSKPLRFKQLDPKGRTERTLRLTPGRYTLWCSIAGHKAKGMRTTLLVKK